MHSSLDLLNDLQNESCYPCGLHPPQNLKREREPNAVNNFSPKSVNTKLLRFWRSHGPGLFRAGFYEKCAFLICHFTFYFFYSTACGTCSQKDLLASAESYSEGIGGEGRPHPPRPHVRCPKTASGKQLPHSHRPSENKQGSSGDASTFRAPHPSQVRGPDETRQTPPTPPPRPRGKPAARLPAGAGAALAASGSEPSGSAWWPRQQPVSGRGEAPDAWK